MLIFDQLRKNDPQLRVLTWGVLAGMVILLAGLWYVQVLSYRHFNENQKSQAYRTVRIPAIRGKILDRHGNPLAENRPSYNVMLYLDELRDLFRDEWRRSKPKTKLTRAQRNGFESDARYRVASNIVHRLSEILQEPLFLTRDAFFKHYTNQLALPLPVLQNLNPEQIARFQEQANHFAGVDLEVQPLRHYPNGKTAAHLLGYLTKDNSSVEGEDAFFNFRLPDYRGRVGIEWAFDQQLRGRAGMKSVLVNSLGYRQSETIWNPAEPGKNVALTIDLTIQHAAEKALQTAAVTEPPVRGAVVVMDPQNGNVLAMASNPSFDPNAFIPQISHEEYAKLTDEFSRPQLNRATQENYHPGSIFKIVVALAALDAGLDPMQKFYCPRVIYIGRRGWHDPQAPVDGEYNFRQAFMKSSNSYFITNGLIYGPEGIVRLGEQFHLGEKTQFEAGHETRGSFPSSRTWRRGWSDGDTANLSIGQGSIDVTPLQMAIMTAAVANGGKVLRPRLIERIEPQDTFGGEKPTFMPPAQIRGQLRVQPRSLEIVRNAMLGDVEDAEGSGKAAFVPGMRVCGKTGTAQRGETGKFQLNTWFASYAPFESPRYVVVVMVESGASGGKTCAPVAGKIYKAIQELESSGNRPRPALVAEAR